MAKNSELRRRQLDRTFTKVKELNLERPKKGWVKEVRNALGMSMEDLGKRLGVIKQRIQTIEKSEVEGKITLESLRKAAKAMNCNLVYFIVPKASLEDTVENQAESIARGILANVDKTMALENQSIDSVEQERSIAQLKNKILTENFNKLWKLK